MTLVHLPAGSEWSDLENRHLTFVLPADQLTVHLNMVELDNGQEEHFKPKRHNAKLCPLAIRERIVNALAAGDSKRAIARTLRVSNNTVTAVAEQEWQQVEARKARIAAQAERAATRAFDRINNKLDSHADIPLNILVPVAGMSVDKFTVLRGDPNIVARIEHAPSGNIFQAYAELVKAIEARTKANADCPPTAQLALPNGETGPDSLDASLPDASESIQESA